MRYKTLILLAALLIVLVVAIEPVMAGPGGKIARAVFETFWGKVLLGVLTIIFLPFIIYVIWRERLAEKRARKDLRFMSAHSPAFEWLKIKERATDCFYRVHSAWQKEDVSEAADWMTSWYWQNQQMVFLDKWEREGLINVCDVKRIKNMKPLLFVHRNDGAAHEDSMVVISITANMKDYLAERDGGKVVEGSKKYKDVETIWSFTMTGGKWVVSNIEEDDMSLAYARLTSELPRIEDTLAKETHA